MEDQDRPALTEIVITPEMIEAGARELVFDSELVRIDVAEDIIRAALESGGYLVISKSAEVRG